MMLLYYFCCANSKNGNKTGGWGVCLAKDKKNAIGIFRQSVFYNGDDIDCWPLSKQQMEEFDVWCQDNKQDKIILSDQLIEVKATHDIAVNDMSKFGEFNHSTEN